MEISVFKEVYGKLLNILMLIFIKSCLVWWSVAWRKVIFKMPSNPNHSKVLR